eukprot:11436480-Alexandrium_andersonii.AAC.1
MLDEVVVPEKVAVLDEAAALPAVVAHLVEGLGLKAELGPDDGADDGNTVREAVPEDEPHVGGAARRAAE